MKLLRKAFFALIVLTLLASLVLWGLANKLRPDTIKPYINARITALTGCESHINGAMNWTLYPSPGIKIKDLSIGSQDASTPYFITLEDLSLNLKLSSFLQGQLLFNEIKMKGLHLEVHANATPIAVRQQSLKGKKNNRTNFSAERFLLSHGEITYPYQGNMLKISNIQLGAESITLEKFLFPIQVKANIQDQQKISAILNFKGKTHLSSAFIHDPLHHLKDLILDGQINVQNLKSHKLSIENINANTSLHNEILVMKPLSLTLYQGQSLGNLQYNLKNKALELNQTATHLNAKLITQDLFEQSLFKGSLDLSLHLKTQLEDNWLHTMEGHGNLSIKEGEIQLIDLNASLQNITEQTQRLLTQEALTAESNVLLLSNTSNEQQFQNGNTIFSLLSIPFQIYQGTIDSDNALLQTDNIRIKGQGRLDLTSLKIKSQLSAILLNMSPHIAKIQKMLGGYFPIQLSGTLIKPIFQADTEIINPFIAKVYLNYTINEPIIDMGQNLKKVINL